jgi:hypothetical protein
MTKESWNCCAKPLVPGQTEAVEIHSPLKTGADPGGNSRKRTGIRATGASDGHPVGGGRSGSARQPSNRLAERRRAVRGPCISYMEGPHSYVHIAFFASGIKPPNTDARFTFGNRGKRILEMLTETPCAHGSGGGRNSVTATTDSDPGAIQGPGQEGGNADQLAASGGAVSVAGHGGRRAIGGLQGWWPREASASHTCRGLAPLRVHNGAALSAGNAEPGRLVALVTTCGLAEATGLPVCAGGGV